MLNAYKIQTRAISVFWGHFWVLLKIKTFYGCRNKLCLFLVFSRHFWDCRPSALPLKYSKITPIICWLFNKDMTESMRYIDLEDIFPLPPIPPVPTPPSVMRKQKIAFFFQTILRVVGDLEVYGLGYTNLPLVLGVVVLQKPVGWFHALALLEQVIPLLCY